MDILRKYKSYYPESSGQAQNILSQIRESEEAIEKYRGLGDFKQTVGTICSAAEKQKSEIIMPMIQDFYRKFPQGKYPGLEADYQKITEIQTQAAGKIVETIDKGLDQCKPEDAQNEREKQSSYDASIKIIDDKLPLLQGTPQYAVYKARRDVYWNNLNKSKRDELFHNELKKLQETLQKPLSPDEKIREIDAFVAKFKNEYSVQCEEFGHRRSQLVEERKWLRLKADIEKHLARMPDDSSSAQLRSYQEKCREYKDALSSFTASCPTVRTGVEKAETDLDDMIQKINNKIGDGSFADIQEKKRDYDDAPNETTYQTLKKTLEAFDDKKPENSAHADKVKGIKEKFEKDWAARNEVTNSWQKLRDTPNFNNYNSFQHALMTAEKDVYAHRDELDNYKKRLNFLRGDTVFVELVELSGFENLGTVGGELRVKLYARDKHSNPPLYELLLDFKCDGYSWEKGQRATRKDGEFKKDNPNFSQRLFTICSIGNWQSSSGMGDHVEIPVKPWEILVRLASGENEVKKNYSCPRGVSVTLKFTKE